MEFTRANCVLVSERRRNIVTEDFRILPPNDYDPTSYDKVSSSFYDKFVDSLNGLGGCDGEAADFVWLFNDSTGESLTVAEAISRSQRSALAFSEAGISRHDVVHVLSNESAITSIFGLFIIGAVPALADSSQGPETLQAQMINSGSKWIVCSPATRSTAHEVVSLLKTERDANLVTINAATFVGTCDDAIITDKSPTHMHEPALIIFSSGTTGTPKGIVHSHMSLWNWLNGTLDECIPKNSKVVTTLQCNKISGFSFAVCAARKRCTVIHGITDPSGRTVLEAIKKHEPRSLILLSNHFVQLASLDENAVEDWPSQAIKQVTSVVPAASSIPFQSEVDMRSKFPNLKSVPCVYGSSETGIFTYADTNTHLGSLMSNVEAKVVDLTTGARIGPGKEGEICVKSELMMLGYLNQEEATEAFYDNEGFAKMGDVGYYDIDGTMHFKERIKEMIKYNNVHVSPSAVEAGLRIHPGVSDCLVFGKPNPPTVELVSALVQKKSGFHNVTEDELKQFVSDQVSSDYQRIRGDLIFVDKVPRNAMGKLLRRRAKDYAKPGC